LGKGNFKLFIELTQNSSDLHYENFLTYCRFQLVQIMVPEGQSGGHKREKYFYICIF
jgi:hypothetical protein